MSGGPGTAVRGWRGSVAPGQTLSALGDRQIDPPRLACDQPGQSDFLDDRDQGVVARIGDPEEQVLVEVSVEERVSCGR
jgi:hypothetical protein